MTVKNGMRLISFFHDIEQYRKLKAYAEGDRRTLSNLLKIIVDDWIRANKDKIQEMDELLAERDLED